MPKKKVNQKWSSKAYETVLERNAAAFREMHPELLKHYKGQWVVIYDGKLVDYDVNDSKLFRRMMKKYGYYTPWYIQRVVEEIIPIEIVPGMDID
jgi:hypothetical protein